MNTILSSKGALVDSILLKPESKELVCQTHQLFAFVRVELRIM